MPTRKIILKTAPKRRGTIPRATVRRAVEAVFGKMTLAGRKKGSSRSIAAKARTVLTPAK